MRGPQDEGKKEKKKREQRNGRHGEPRRDGVRCAPAASQRDAKQKGVGFFLLFS